MDEPTSIQICGLIAGVLASDGHMHAHEASFLQRVRTRLGLPREARVTPVLDRDEAIGKLRGLSEEVRRETLELLIQAAAADGKVSPAERTLLDAVAGELKVPAAQLDERLESAIATSRPQPFEPDDEP